MCSAKASRNISNYSPWFAELCPANHPLRNACLAAQSMKIPLFCKITAHPSEGSTGRSVGIRTGASHGLSISAGGLFGALGTCIGEADGTVIQPAKLRAKTAVTIRCRIFSMFGNLSDDVSGNGADIGARRVELAA